MLRRTSDVLLSLWVLAITVPFLPLVAILIKFDSDGPVFFRQERVGRNGRTFTLYKLRTMTSGSDPAQKRITRVGRVLRPLRLDELPQLANVIRGDMAVFGPRPPLPTEVDMENPLWQQILSVRPGLMPAR
jgi:lipopolysaccharide/colanic/teichoic acid biosynthesis glycosyltransferase